MNLRPKLPWVLGIAALVGWAAWHGHQNSCGPFPDWQSSPYVLPYRVGSTHYVNQANCSNGGHQGPFKYAYDFVMPIGTTVTAARAGVVADVRMKFRDGQHGEDESNWIKLRHPDGSFALRTLTVEDYISRNSKAFATMGFFERELARTSDSFGQIAQVFSTYESRHATGDAKPFQRGINSLQLYNDGKRWWVVNLVWRAEDERLPLPERYLHSR